MAQNNSPMVSVKSFVPANVIGYLGHPLGTVVRVTGTAVDADSTRMKSDSGELLLRIETVNGKRVEDPPLFRFGRAAKEIEKPKPDQKFDYYVHEYGFFDGVVELPEVLGIEKITVANDGFYYRPAITIHKSN